MAGIRIDQAEFHPRLMHCVVFLGKTLYSHSASLIMGNSKFNA